ncbi:MAG: sugar phosphate isomerase/epimerase [Dysgonamonadaceae bacterium]|jgi:sugar phosphate isomerase/epimerase|nr:sugar phosphate isomerase/epimerase [Dysgonamonadaceae bacterium]
MKKQFLFLTVLLAFAVSSCCTQSKGTEEKQDKNIYLQLYSVRDDINADFKGTIQKVAEIGYTGVEAAGYADGKFYGLEPEEYKKEVEAAGMTVLSSHTGRALDQDVTKTNWDEVWKWWDQAIAAHKAAGMKYIVTAWMPTPKTLAELQSYCDYYNQIGEKCKAAGISYGYHNHNFEFQEIEGQLMYDYMLKNTDPEKVFFQMDVYWVIRGGKAPVDYFVAYPGRFKLLHIKDEKELGQSGMVGFDAIFRNLATAGAQYAVVEVERYSYTPIESVKLSYDYLIDSPFVKADELK